jgi:hypothetical protein
MSEVFISYKSEDRAHVRVLVEGLRRAGLAVWWDQDIAPNAPWEATIEAALRAAGCVIVCWSARAVGAQTGAKVQVEARDALNAGKLLQVLLERCEPPLFFRQYQAADLSDWRGEAGGAKFQALAQAARDVLAGKPPADFAPPARRQPPWGVLTALFVGLSGALGFIANLGGARDAACSLAALEKPCRDVGLISEAQEPAPEADPAIIRAAERSRLLGTMNGRWARGDIDPITGQPRNCSQAMTIAITKDEAGIERVQVRAVGFESSDQVETAADGVVRVNGRGANGVMVEGKYEPNGDRLVYTSGATPTTLFRCPSASE